MLVVEDSTLERGVFVKSLTDGLPPDIARQVHPDWRKNESAYWAARDRLLPRYEGRWIAFTDGSIVASSSSPVEVFQQAHASGLHPFVTCVGREDEPCHVRRASFPYDTAYVGEALPVIDVEFRTTAGSTGTVLDRVIITPSPQGRRSRAGRGRRPKRPAGWRRSGG
jgi:hypothetical protein